MLFVVLMLFVATGCSRKKDKFINRSWHSLNTKYNILYNGGIALETGKTAINSTFIDNYWDILPVERLQPTDDIILGVKAQDPNFGRAEEKAVKAIQVHGMNIKGKEKNPQIDESYILLGKARYFDNRFIPAQEAFNYILFKYPASSNINLAKIWRAKTNLRLENEGLAIKNLKELIESNKLSNEDNVAASSALAQAYITTKALDSAIIQLQRASQLTKDNHELGRLRFIEGQLYSSLGIKDSSNLAFDQVIALNRKTPRVYMISAHLEKIKNFDFENDNKLILEALLENLESNRENRPFLDKIYHQIANYQIKNNKDSLAIAYYNKSLRTDSKDAHLTALNYRILADLNFDYSEYSLAGSYYDSTLLSLQDNSKSFRAIKRKRDNLEDVIYYEAVAHETDSVLRLVELSQSEKEAYFQTYIENLKLEEEALEKEDATPREAYFVPTLNEVRKKDKTFYFYNPTTLAFGKNEFVRIWGARALEANWRWSNKTVRNEEVVEKEFEEAEMEVDKSRFTIAYYLAQIPSEESILDSISKERNFAYYQLGLIYKDKFKEYTLSQNKLEQLLKQFPEDRLVLPTKYNLYKVYSLLGLSQSQAILKKDIIENHKDSRYAAILLNPELALLNNENSPQSLYNNLYTQFELGNYQEVIDGCDLQITRLDGDEIVPKLELLKATSRARLYGFEAYKEGLNFVALNYPSSLEGKKAAQMYSTIIPELANKAFVEDSTQTNFKVVFKFDRSEVEEINTFETALSTAVEEVDYFNLTVSRDGYNTNTIFVVVHGLKSVQGALGFVKILETENELIISKPYFGISSMNYQIVQIHKNAERYIKSIK
ncbi:MAG: type IX secretion system periplasmic lipoprotein PorW/SprE [Flavobacteriales bacterium]